MPGPLRLLGIAVPVLALAALGGWFAAGAWQPARTDFALQGMDVTSASGAVDWPTAKAGGADFGYARATFGTSVRDPRFAGHWAGMAEAGVRRGAIHHFALCQDADGQAANFIRTVPRADDALPAALELDDDDALACAAPSRADVIAGIARFVTAVETHTGKPMLLKLSSAFETRFQVSAALARPLWSSRMFRSPDYATRPWRMWQANPVRRIDGAEGPVGWDVVAP